MMTETPPNIDKCTMIRGTSREEIERKIDASLADKKPFRDVPLILPISGASRTTYRGISVRRWECAGNVRFDSAVEVLDGSAAGE